MMDLQIREMSIEDAGSIAKLSGQFGYQSSEEETKERILLLKRFPDNCCFVAVYDNEIIGWIHVMMAVRIESSPFFEISGFVVDERYRGQGFGKQLVEKVISWCKRKGINKLRVRCNVTRIRSHEFYLKQGFKETKVSKIFEVDLKAS
jgi:GNAT superfamily N-acetyltransferase